jgi:hypothetical protein
MSSFSKGAGRRVIGGVRPLHLPSVNFWIASRSRNFIVEGKIAVVEQNVTGNSRQQASESVETSNEGKDKSVTLPMPHEEQLKYWKRDLRYKLVTLIISVTSLFISITGFILILRSINLNQQQVSINTDHLRLNTSQAARLEKYQRANVQNSIFGHVNTLNQVFMDKPYLRPYFYGGKAIDEKDARYLEVSALAEMMIDVFDLISGQNRYFPEYWESPEAWDEWIIDMFSNSPILRDTYDKYSHWYDESLIDLRKKGQLRLEAKANQGQN